MNRKLLLMRFKILVQSKYNFWILMIIVTVISFAQALIVFRSEQTAPWIAFDIIWILINILAFAVAVWNVVYYLFNRKDLRK